MSEIDATSEVGATFDERQRAYDHFNAVLAVHNAAINAFELLPTLPDAAEIVASGLRLRRGLRPNETAEWADGYADRMFDSMLGERNRGYEVIRGSALIAACGAFEYLVKATFVNQASADPAKAAALLAGTKIRLLASDVLGLPPTEQWYVIADELFDQLGNTDRQMHKRVERLFLEYVYLPDRAAQKSELDKAFEALDKHKFNEAFLVRNCLVHNGGRVSNSLARHTKQVAGERIVFRDRILGSLLRPMQDLAKQLDSLWLGFL